MQLMAGWPGSGSQQLAHGPESVVRGATDAATLQALAVMRDELGAAYAAAIATPELDDTQRATLVRLATSIGSES
jgi:hypothetical protein